VRSLWSVSPWGCLLPQSDGCIFWQPRQQRLYHSKGILLLVVFQLHHLVFQCASIHHLLLQASRMIRSSRFHHGNSSDFTLVPSLRYIVALSDLSEQENWASESGEHKRGQKSLKADWLTVTACSHWPPQPSLHHHNAANCSGQATAAGSCQVYCRSENMQRSIRQTGRAVLSGQLWCEINIWSSFIWNVKFHNFIKFHKYRNFSPIVKYV